MQTHILNNEYAKRILIKAIDKIELDGSIVVEIKKHVKKRTNQQNSLAWAGMLNDFSMQVVIDGRKFLPETWHEQLKRNFLPEGYDEELTLKGYQKWDLLPDGSMKLVGSTTQLTTKGFSQYMEACYAYGAGEFGVRFSTNRTV